MNMLLYSATEEMNLVLEELDTSTWYPASIMVGPAGSFLRGQQRPEPLSLAEG